MKHLRTFFLAATLLLQCLQSKAQDIGGSIVKDYEERKEKALAALKNFTQKDTARVNALLDLIATALIKKQREELDPYCDEALSISRRLNFRKGLAKCYIFKGHLSKNESDRFTAQQFYDSAIQIAKGSTDNNLQLARAQGFRGKAWIYYEQENYYSALNNFFEALKYYEGIDKTAAMNVYTNIATIYSRVNNLPQAIVYATKNVALAEAGNDKDMHLQAYLALAQIYIQNDELHLASIYLGKMKPYIPDPVQSMINSGYYMNRGLIFFKTQQYDSAVLCYREAYEVAVASRHPVNKTAALFYLSKSTLLNGNLELAKKYAEENLATAEQTNSRIGKINALLNLSDYYHATKNNDKGYEYLQRAGALKDSLLTDANINQINTLAAVYESDKKEKEILQLHNEKDIQAAAVKRKSLLNKVFTASIFALLFFGYLGFQNFKKGQHIAKQERTLQQQKIVELEKDKQLLAYTAVLKGQEEERSRIAKELHDGIGSLLSGTKMSFMNVKENLELSAENKIIFERSVSMLDNTIGDLRKVAQNLLPEALVKFGLQDAVKDFCFSMQSSSGIKVLYQQYGETRKLDNTSAVFIYRIIQELVNNAVKHADASKIIVQLTMSNDKTGITVEDNGKGFDINTIAATQGNGIANIKYRVEYLNGTLDIISSPRNGTSVNIQLLA